MARTLTEIRVFAASPGDLAEEREALAEVVEDLGHAFDGLHVRLFRWEKDTYPAMGRPQGVVNEQAGDFDVFVGLMWKRFGQPTGEAGSGTEEEFNRAYERWEQTGRPPILFYFCERPFYPRTDEEMEQFAKVRAFRTRVESGGLTGRFETADEFKREVRRGLTQVLREFSPDDLHGGRGRAPDATLEGPVEHERQSLASRSSRDQPLFGNVFVPRRRRQPTDRERRAFVRDGFATIRDYFRQAAAALEAHDPEVHVDVEEDTARSFICEVFVRGQSKGICRLWISAPEEIAYVERSGPGAFPGNAMNDYVEVDLADDGALVFRASGMAHNQTPGQHLTPEGAAEHFWRRVTAPLTRG